MSRSLRKLVNPNVKFLPKKRFQAQHSLEVIPMTNLNSVPFSTLLDVTKNRISSLGNDFEVLNSG